MPTAEKSINGNLLIYHRKRTNGKRFSDLSATVICKYLFYNTFHKCSKVKQESQVLRAKGFWGKM